MSTPGLRLARQMQPHLGTELWDEFMEHAENRHYNEGWLRAFAPESGVLRCVGTFDGAPCAGRSEGAGLSAGAGTGVEEEHEGGTPGGGNIHTNAIGMYETLHRI